MRITVGGLRVAAWLVFTGVIHLTGQTALASVAGLLGAGPQAGFRATGTATVYTLAGPRTARVSVTVWGAEHSRVVVEFPTGERYSATANQGRIATSGPSGWLRLPVVSPLNNGCDLLPQGLPIADAAGGQLTSTDKGPTPGEVGLNQGADEIQIARKAHPAPTVITLDLGPTGLPLRSAYSGVRGELVEVRYMQYATGNGFAYPAHVEERVSGELRLVVDFASVVAAANLTDAQFPVPAPPARPGAHSAGHGENR